MKDVTKPTASEMLAQMMAVTAMIVIASVVFYWR
jgi:preprotein translocase subunit SecE